jgi:superfamily II DNA or RNA helicase
VARQIRLRPWQVQALERLGARTSGDFLAVATPGAGKTTFALAAALRAVQQDPATRVVVVAPTAHLKIQWATAAARFGLQLDPSWSPGPKAAARPSLPADLHGIVTTYQQVASSARALRALTPGAFVVLDEIHHAGEERAWGDSVRSAFDPAATRLCLSGTPFRSDTRSIPFVRYRMEEAESDFEYGYADALRDGGVVRPVYFPRINGFMEWQAPDGTINAASFDDDLDRQGSQQRLRTALSVEGDWLPTVLRQAHEQLLAMRRRRPRAGGLVIATDQDHARAIADLMRWRLQTEPVVVLSDDPQASQRIADFDRADTPWIVAVRMVSEGVDIPRLAIGVFATTTTTELFFRQAVGRLVRWIPDAVEPGPDPAAPPAAPPAQKAFMFIPDDPRLRSYAFQIAESRRHSLRRAAEDGREAMDGPPEHDPAALDAPTEATAEQLSLFTALSAVVTDGPHKVWSVFDDEFEIELDAGRPGTGTDANGPDANGTDANGPDANGTGGLLEVPELAPGLRAVLGGPGTASGLRFERREALRLRNAELAKDLARTSGLGHAKVNAELNRRSGISGVDDATLEQLERRVAAAERWWGELTRPRRIG